MRNLFQKSCVAAMSSEEDLVVDAVYEILSVKMKEDGDVNRRVLNEQIAARLGIDVTPHSRLIKVHGSYLSNFTHG